MNQDPVPAPCRRGGSLTGGHLHHPDDLHDEEGVVHPRGWGYVPIAMCLISLSLSLSCSWFGTILMYRELCYYSWILWCFSSLVSCNGLSFPFEVILSDWVFKDLRTLDVCLACAYLWWQWDIHMIYLMYVLVINLRVQWPCELMHRGWHTFSSWLSVRNFGALFEVLCVGWIDESEIEWCISYNHAHGYLRWQWST